MNEELKKEIPIQGVILADSYETSFRPLTLEYPKALLPLANVPMIEYSLEFLIDSDIKQIVVVCSWLADKVEEYIKNSRWGRYLGADPSDGLCITVEKYKAITNAGDAMRELDRSSIIKSDPFVLVSGDVVANVKLKPIIEAHKARRKQIKQNLLMTMVFNRVDTNKNRLRVLNEELLVAMDAKTKQILKYENNLDNRRLTLADAELFDDHPMIELRYNLLDCYIDICSPEMIAQIADNFDYQDLRSDYVKNEVQNHELGGQIYAYELTSSTEYACRVRDPRTYHAVSGDIVRRWIYPLSPDANWSTEKTSYQFERGFRYRDSNVRIDRSAVIGENTMLGANTRVGKHSTISNSIIGEHCVIGENVKITDSYLWGNVTVEDGSIITNSIISQKAKIGKNVMLMRGVVLGENVEIEGPRTIKEYCRITTVPYLHENQDDGESDFGEFSDEDNSEEEPIEEENNADIILCDPDLVGAKGKGIRYLRAGGQTIVPKWARTAVGGCLCADVSIQFSDIAQGMGASELELARNRVWSMADVGESDEEGDSNDKDDDLRFLRDIRELCKGGVENQDNINLELKCFAHAENRSFEDVIITVIPQMCSNIRDPVTAVDSLKSCLSDWTPTLNDLCPDVDTEAALVLALELLFLYGAEESGKIGLEILSGQFQLESHPPTNAALLGCKDQFIELVNFLICDGRLVSCGAVIQWSVSHDLRNMPNNLVCFKPDPAMVLVPIVLCDLKLKDLGKTEIISLVKQRLGECQSIFDKISQDRVSSGVAVFILELFMVYEKLSISVQEGAHLSVQNQGGLQAFPFILLHLYSDMDVISADTLDEWKRFRNDFKLPFEPTRELQMVIDSIEDQDSEEESSDDDDDDSSSGETSSSSD